MCILIDTCRISKVFNYKNVEHYRFEPVKDYIIYGIGKMVYGGSKYKRELFAIKNIGGLLKELKIVRKIIELCDEDIDYQEMVIEDNNDHPLF